MTAADDATRALLRELAEVHGTPCYVYLLRHVSERIDALRAAFGGRLRISFAVKSNPNAALLGWLRGRIERLDVSSAGELRRALRAGWQGDRLTFTGPAKSAADFCAAIQSGAAVVLESVREAHELNESAAAIEAAAAAAVLARIAPARVPRGYGLSLSGRATQFGIDEEVLDPALAEIAALPRLRLDGFHVYSGTQCLDADAVAENLRIQAVLYQQAAQRHGLRPRVLIFGLGMGVPLFEKSEPLDLARLAASAEATLDGLRRDPSCGEAELVLELGRFLIGEAGYYLTRVVHLKHSRGANIAVCDGGMHQHLASSGGLGAAFHRNHRIDCLTAADPRDAPRLYDLAGPLCTSIDSLGRGVMLPELRLGDVLAVACSGAYGPTASPLHFIGRELPREIVVDADGRVLSAGPVQLD